MTSPQECSTLRLASSLLSTAADQAEAWLFEAALPLWSGAGFDRRRNAFHERLDQDGKPTEHARRVFVQARQIFVFCEAGHLGWGGHWEDIVRHATASLLATYRRSDGAFTHAVACDGAVINDDVDLYDQAFVLFALAHAYQSCGRPTEWRFAAFDILAYIRRERVHRLGGFSEPAGSAVALRQNPHMHLLEAALIWASIDREGPWEGLVHEIVDVARERMIDQDTGCLFEVFADDWSVVGGRNTGLVEPGHQFEWAWLFHSFAENGGDFLGDLVWPLVTFGETHGRDPTRGVIIHDVDAHGRALDRQARIWAQTERLRCCIALLPRASHTMRPGLLAGATEAAACLPLFLDTPIKGLWRDRWDETGFVGGSAPASSLYHLMTAYSTLICAARRGSAAE